MMPIIFFGPMVRAILDGTKTQTRRVVKPQPEWVQAQVACIGNKVGMQAALCPYGRVGDKLWVKEGWQSWKEHDALPPSHIPNMMAGRLNYLESGNVWDAKRRSPLHMPRWASRLSLRITAVRVERLQEISEEDAKAEGVQPLTSDAAVAMAKAMGMAWKSIPYTSGFASTWESIHVRGSWAANPWVWVLEFERVTP